MNNCDGSENRSCKEREKELTDKIVTLEGDLETARALLEKAFQQNENLNSELAVFKRLLAYPDNDLWDFINGKAAPPDPEAAHILKLFE